MERRVRWGGRSRAGCSQQTGDKGTPCPVSERSGWSTGRLASLLVNVQMNTAVLHIPHQTMFSLLYPLAEYPSLSQLPANNRHRGALRREKWVEGTGGANSTKTSREGSGTQGAVVRSETRFSGVKFHVHETQLTSCLVLLSFRVCTY